MGKPPERRPSHTKTQHSAQVLGHQYFHGVLPNSELEQLLKVDGDFILRSYVPEKDPSANPQITLALFWAGSIRCAVIKEIATKAKPSRFMLGNNTFDSIDELIDHYYIRKQPLILAGVHVSLDNPLRRPTWELRHHQVHINRKKQLGEGAYGRVFRGILKKHDGKDVNIEVAVKELYTDTPAAAAEIWKEARVMRLFDHHNVVKMYGVCNDKEPFLLVTEFVRGGSLDSYFEKHNSLNALNAKKRIQILLEGAQGIEYIHQKGTIHRDIGARNFLIDTVVKVADFGLARNVGMTKRKGYKIDTEADCNLRWIAPDAFSTGVVDAKTDVYAFGVTIWETFKIPYEKPYDEWDGPTVYEEVVEKGFRLKPTEHMPSGVAELMSECLAEPSSRPDFKAIVTCLRLLLTNPRAKLGIAV